MKTVCKKLFSLLLVAVLLVSVLPFQALAATGDAIVVQFLKYNWDGTYSVAKSYNMTVPTMTGAESQGVSLPTTPEGYRFDGWVVYSQGMTFDQVAAAERARMDIFRYGDTVFAPAYVKDTYTVSFNTNMTGVTAPAAMTVTNNKEFGYAGGMPVPTGTAKGYSFGGWKYGDVTLDHSTWYGTKFTSGEDITLDAVWVPDNLTVTFYRFNDSVGGYEAIKAVTVPYGKTVNINDIPALSDLNARDKYEAIGWQTSAGADATVVDPSTKVITSDTGFYARYLGDEITITLDYKDSKLNNGTKIVRIGEKIGAYGGKLPTPALTGYTFIGWYTPDGTKVTDETVFWNSYSKLEAHWAVQAQVRLLVYKTGDTTTPIVSRLIPGGISNGQLDVESINISSYLPSGNTYKLTGYFDKDGWTDYVMNGIARTVDNVNCGSVGVTEVYAMVEVISTNNTGSNNTGSGSNNTGSGNNTNKTPADPSNPATGDNNMIVASMTVMTLSAAALVVFMQLRKRKMI